jgi:hypothetical protein
MKVLSNSLLFYVVLALLPTSAALFRVYVHQDTVQLGYALSAQERLRDQLQGRLQALQVEVAAARSPARLTTLAQNMGLRPPQVTQVVSGYTTQAHLARADLAKARHARR